MAPEDELQLQLKLIEKEKQIEKADYDARTWRSKHTEVYESLGEAYDSLEQKKEELRAAEEKLRATEEKSRKLEVLVENLRKNANSPFRAKKKSQSHRPFKA